MRSLTRLPKLKSKSAVKMEPNFLYVGNTVYGRDPFFTSYSDFVAALGEAAPSPALHLIGHSDGLDVWYTDQEGRLVLLFMPQYVADVNGQGEWVLPPRAFASPDELIAALAAHARPGTWVRRGYDVWATPRAGERCVRCAASR